MSANKGRLSLWDAIRFVWHYTLHPSHGETVWHDVRSDVARCGCGRTWGAR